MGEQGHAKNGCVEAKVWFANRKPATAREKLYVITVLGRLVCPTRLIWYLFFCVS